MKRISLIGVIFLLFVMDKGVAQNITFAKALSMLQFSDSSLDSALKANAWKVSSKWEYTVEYSDNKSVLKSKKFVIVRFNPVGTDYKEIEVLFRSSKKFRKFLKPFKTENFNMIGEHNYYGFTLKDFIEKSNGRIVIQLKKYANYNLGQSIIFYNTEQYYRHRW